MECDVTLVVMEQTGDYWQNLYTELDGFGSEAVLANGKVTKNAKGKKTDVKDCRSIQTLHTLGLLTGSFLRDLATEQLRAYFRQRGDGLEPASATHKMHKFLQLPNMVVKEVCGLVCLSIRPTCRHT